MTEITFKLILFLFPLAYSPGPGNMFFAANAARFGLSATIPSIVGYHIATWVVTILIGLGFGLVVAEFPNFLVLIKYLGSFHVLYLAWCLFRAGALEGEEVPKHAGFVDGAILLLFNPKAYLIIVLMFTQFSSSADGTHLLIIFWITTIFTLNNFIAFTIWAFVGDRLAAVFRQDSKAQYLNMVFGGILAIVTLWMLAS